MCGEFFLAALSCFEAKIWCETWKTNTNIWSRLRGHFCLHINIFLNPAGLIQCDKKNTKCCYMIFSCDTPTGLHRVCGQSPQLTSLSCTHKTTLVCTVNSSLLSSLFLPLTFLLTAFSKCFYRLGVRAVARIWHCVWGLEEDFLSGRISSMHTMLLE